MERLLVERLVELAVVAKKAVVVAWVEVAKPKSAPPSALKVPVIVVEPVTASEVEVAPWSEVPPRTVSAPLALSVLPTVSVEESVVEPVTKRLVEVAPPEMVRPPPSVPLPMVEEAAAMMLWIVEVGER